MMSIDHDVYNVMQTEQRHIESSLVWYHTSVKVSKIMGKLAVFVQQLVQINNTENMKDQH